MSEDELNVTYIVAWQADEEEEKKDILNTALLAYSRPMSGVGI